MQPLALVVLGISSARALGISEDNISEDCSVSMELANRTAAATWHALRNPPSEESKNYSAGSGGATGGG